MVFKNSLTLLTILICVESSLTVFSPFGCHAQENDPSSETVTLVEKVQIPVEVNGKEVGKTSLPAGTKVTVVSRDGARVSIKRGNLGPVWVEASQLSGLSDKKPEQPSTPVKTDPAIELQKLNRLVSENKWAQVAAFCETIAQADEKFSGLAELAGQLKSALQAQTSAVQQQKKAETEAQRLRRNADVVGQPNRLNPSDRSPMERAQKLREEADFAIEEANNAYAASEAQIAQSGADVSKEIGRMESEASAQIASVDTRSAALGQHNEDTRERPEQPDRKQASRNNQKTAPDDKFGQLGVMRLAGVFSVKNYQQSANERLEAFASGATPQIGMDYQTCVARFPVTNFGSNTEQRDARYSEWVVTLDEGWTRALFRVGDLLADILFSPEQKAEFITLAHIDSVVVFVLAEEPLKLLCRGIAPGYEWSLEVADRRTKSNELRWVGTGTRDQAEDVWVAAKEKVLIAHTSRAHDFVHKYRDALDQGTHEKWDR